MGGYVTQTRSREELVPHTWRADSNVSQGNTPGDQLFGVALTVPTQVTTSYRDSSNRVRDRRYSDESVDLPDTLGAAFQQYRSDKAGRGSTPYDNGHTFVTTDRSREFSHKRVLLRSTDGRYEYQGPIYSDPGAASSQFVVPSTIDFGWYGTRAVAETAPTNPVAGLAQTLAEIKREGLPRLAGLRKAGEEVQGMSREAGSEYLNTQFGWKPLVSDATNLLSAIVDADKHIRQYQRNAGRHVRRSYYFPETVESTTPTHTIGSGSALCYGTARSPLTSTQRSVAQSTLFPSRTGTLTRYTETTRKIWFKGAFTYALPGDFTSRLGRLRTLEAKFHHLFGTRLSPDLLWNLAPWTWLADWEFNIGDILTNVRNLQQDGLVIQYGYMMATSVTKHIRIASGVPKYGGGYWDPVTTTFITTRKERVRVNPYGFGSDPASYTNRQWAILAALGMTKNPGQLRTD